MADEIEELLQRTSKALAHLRYEELENLVQQAHSLSEARPAYAAAQAQSIQKAQASLKHLLHATAQSLRLFQSLHGEEERPWAR